MRSSPLGGDLDEIIERSRDDLAALRGSRFFISGGTGFVGKWLLEALLRANDRLDLRLMATVLTRSPEAFKANAPRLAAAGEIAVVRGDARRFTKEDGHYDVVIHAATASAEAQERDPAFILETIVESGRNVLELAARSGQIPVLFTSSGAIYGRMPDEMERFPESYTGAPDPLDRNSAYAEGKRVGELQCALYARDGTFEPKIARLFAFVGPYLPLNANFAAGNFIRDALKGGPIEISGDGTAIRSYLYAGDMVVWLLAVLLRGKPLRPYNVGSEIAVKVKDLAEEVAAATSPRPTVRVMRTRAGSDRYVPDTKRAREELGLNERISRPEALRRTLSFYRAIGL
jgi:dTDP-glucose 4,6-dehydratase